MPVRKRSGKVVNMAKKNKSRSESKPRLSNTKKPQDLSVPEWQTALRRQMAESSEFEIANTGNGKVYSDYTVFNPQTGSKYKVALRSADNSLNYCSCYDFKTNQLGTCKHIEAILQMIEKDPKLKELMINGYEPAYSSMYMEYRGERKIMFRIGSEDADDLKKLLKPYVKPDGSLNKIGYASIDKIISKAFQINQGFRCYEDALEHIITVREAKQRELFLQPYFDSNKLPALKTLRVHPFQYQIKGILFCALAGRSILADDMGLGKTVQAIGVAQLMHEHFRVEKVLVICPTSLKYQWQTEIEKFTVSKVQVIEGNYVQRKAFYAEDQSLYKVVSYNMAVNDIELINQYQPDLIILDEAQRIKNWQTRVSRGIKKLNSKFALVLTGTPIENKLQELYSLVQFVNPLMLGSLYRFISAHEQTDETGKVIGYKDLHLVKEKLSDILLRRTKKDVLTQLPVRLDKNLFVDITDEQKTVHNELRENVSKIINRWKRLGFLPEDDRQRLMIMLNQMRMVVNSTYIIDQQTNHQTKLDELFNILDEIINNGEEKVVIFSQWERFTRLIAHELDRLNIGYANLNGSVPGHKRKDLFDRFSNDKDCRIFLSTDAGGVGLNLQAASFLINMDLPWNPAVLEQRIARIYRHGQKKPVNIINIIAQHTIEHSMLDKLSFKTALFKGVLDQGESNIFISDDKFSPFMKGIEELIADENTIAEVDVSGISPERPNIPEDQPRKVVQGELFESSDVEQKEDIIEEKMAPAQSPPDLIQTTTLFFSQLTQVLGNPETTGAFVKQLTRKDEATGQTYLQLPVANEKVVEQVVQVLAGLFKGYTADQSKQTDKR